jgi:predicted transcriptional regulator
MRKLSQRELQVMEILWDHGPLPVREVQGRLPAAKRPAYTTVSTVIHRLEAKKALRRVGRIGRANTFQAVTSRRSAYHQIIDEFISAFGSRVLPLMSLFVDVGKVDADVLDKARARINQNRRVKKPD